MSFISKLAHLGIVISLLFTLAIGLFADTPTAHAAAYPCTDAGLNSALTNGGFATFNCAAPTILNINEKKTVTKNLTIDGGGLLTIRFNRAVTINRMLTVTIQATQISDAAVDPTGYCNRDPSRDYFLKGEANNIVLAGVTYDYLKVPNVIYEYTGGVNGNVVTVSNSKTLNSSVLYVTSSYSNNTAKVENFEGGLVVFGSTTSIKNSKLDNFRISSSASGLVENVQVNGNYSLFFGGVSAVKNSLFKGNGGLVNDRLGGKLTVTNSVFQSAYSPYSSGLSSSPIILNQGEMTLSNSTVARNIVSPAYETYYFAPEEPKPELGECAAPEENPLPKAPQPAEASKMVGVIENRKLINAETAPNLTIINSTIAENETLSNQTADTFSAIAARDGTVTLKNTILYNNKGTTGAENCAGNIVDGGNNIQFPGTSCGTSIPSQDPKLTPHSNNGGIGIDLGGTSYAPLVGSPLLDAGNNAVCAAAPINNLDGRGYKRPVGGACDIGAIEGAVGALTGSGSYFYSISPSRLYDSRPTATDKVLGGDGVLAPGNTRTLKAVGNFGIPTNATAILANVAVTNANGGGFLSAFPANQADSGTSTVNWYVNGGRTVSNFAIIGLSPSGEFKLQTGVNSANVIVDVVGYLTPTADTGAGIFKPLGGRLYDSRPNTPANPNTALGAGEGKLTKTSNARTIQVTGNLNIPNTAKAVIVNLTTSNTTGAGFFTLYPSGGTAPNVATLNWGDKTQGNIPRDVANMAIVPLSSDGKMSIVAGGNSDTAGGEVIIDVAGYVDGNTATSGQFVPVVPNRLYDSRPTEPLYAGGLRKGVLEAKSDRFFFVAGALGIPSSAKAVVVRVVTVDVKGGGFLGFFGQTYNGVSSVNVNGANQQIANLAIVSLNDLGRINLRNGGVNPMGMVIDLIGYIN
jgi:hypothetical protein